MAQANPWEIDWTRQGSPAGPVTRPGRPRLPAAQTADQIAIDRHRVEQAPLDREGAELTNEGRRRMLSRLPDNIQTGLSQDVDAFAPFMEAVNSFQDDYSGFGAGVENMAQGYVSGIGTEGQRQWWANFSTADNIARNRLFGASLTPGEEAAYGRTSISPNMTPEEIRRNLSQRARLAQAALGRRVNSLRAQGYDDEALTALLGEYAPMFSREGHAASAEPSAAEDAVTPPDLTIGDVPGGSRGGPGLDRPHQQQVGQQGADALNVGGVPEFRMVSDPRAAGLNLRLAQMLHANAPVGDIARYLQERGLPPQEYMPALNSIAAFRRDHPGFRSQSPEFWLPSISFESVPEATSTAERLHNAVADTTLGAAAIAAGDTVTGGHLDNIVGATGGDAEMTNAVMEVTRNQHPYASLAGDVAAGASLYGAGRTVATQALGRTLPATVSAFAPRALASDAALGAYVGSGQEGTRLASPMGVIGGALTGGAGGAAGRGTISAFSRVASPTGGRMAPLYAQGVEPTIGQRVGGAVDRFEQATTSVPLLGAIPRSARNNAVDQFQRGAFNQALADIGRTLPETVTTGTPAHRFMQRAFNDEFRDIRGQMRFQPDGGFTNDFAGIVNDVALLPDDAQRAFGRLVSTDLGTRLSARGGVLSGDDYVRVASRLDSRARAIRKNPNGDHQLADAFERLSDALDDAAGRHSPQEVVERLGAVRRGYQKAVIIETAGARRGGPAGGFSPSQFDAAVQSVTGGRRSRAYLRGDAPMQDYAEAGLGLGDTLANSGTTDRILASGAVSAAGYASPWTLTPLALSMIANAPYLRKAVNAILAPNRPSLKPVRDAIQRRAPAASLVGPALIPQISE